VSDVERDSLTIRSYRTCFRVERRIYKLDRWRLPLPWGVPLRSLGYAAAALAAVLVMLRVPLLGSALGALHPALRLLGLPLLAAYVLTVVEPDGRAAHHALVAWARWQVSPKLNAAGRAVAAWGAIARLGVIAIAPDERRCEYRPARISGPCRVLLRYPGRADRPRWRRRRLVVTQTSPLPSPRAVTVSIPEGHELWMR
jgi:hypothetical protein